MSVVAEIDPELMRAFGRVMKILRKERKLTLVGLAEKTGLGYNSIRAWQDGRALPNMHNMRALCLGLDLPMWRLLRAVEMMLLADDAQNRAKATLGDVFRVRPSDYAMVDAAL